MADRDYNGTVGTTIYRRLETLRRSAWATPWQGFIQDFRCVDMC